MAESLTPWHALDAARAAEVLQTDLAAGLAPAEAEAGRARPPAPADTGSGIEIQEPDAKA